MGLDKYLVSEAVKMSAGKKKEWVFCGDIIANTDSTNHKGGIQ